MKYLDINPLFAAGRFRRPMLDPVAEPKISENFGGAFHRLDPVPLEGRFAITVDVASGMWWTFRRFGTRGRDADGEVGWS